MAGHTVPTHRELTRSVRQYPNNQIIFHTITQKKPIKLVPQCTTTGKQNLAHWTPMRLIVMACACVPALITTYLAQCSCNLWVKPTSAKLKPFRSKDTIVVAGAFTANQQAWGSLATVLLRSLGHNPTHLHSHIHMHDSLVGPSLHLLENICHLGAVTRILAHLGPNPRLRNGGDRQPVSLYVQVCQFIPNSRRSQT